MRKRVVLVLVVLIVLLCLDLASAALNTNVVWKQFPMKNSWQNSNGKTGGEGMQMVFDIDWNVKNTNRLYLVTDTTKVWRSNDRGNSWAQVGKDIKPKGGVSVVSDPNNADVVFLAASPVSESIMQSDDEGIYRSLDGGQSWKQLGGTMHYIREKHGKLFLFDPGSSDGAKSKVIFAGGAKGLLKSSNGGDTWAQIALNGVYVYDLEWSSGRNYVFISSASGFYKMKVSDNSLTKIGTGLPSHPWDVAVNPKNSSLIYAATNGGVYRSVDGGSNFVKKSSGLDTSVSYHRISISESNPSRLFVSPDQLGGWTPYHSENSGESWDTVDDFNSEEFLSQGSFHAEPVVFDPSDSSIAIMQRDSAIGKTSDTGDSWHFSSNGFTGARVLDIAFASQNSMIFCMLDYGVFVTKDKGASFQNLEIPRVDGSSSCGSVDAVGNTIIATSGGWSNQDIIRSTDGGGSWSVVKTASESFDFIEFNPSNQNIVYADGFYSLNGGISWVATGSGFQIRAIDPHNSGIVYGTKNLGSYVQVAKSQDNGASWTNIGSEIKTTKVFDIDVDPHDTGLHLMVAADEGLYEYKNSAWNFKGASEGLPSVDSNYVAVRFDTLNRGVVWTALKGFNNHGNGIFVSADDGKTWTNRINNLGPYNDVFNIEVSPYDGTVYVTGPGVWTAKISGNATNSTNTTKPFCGDKTCNSNESCSTCSADCGVCPPPPVCGDKTCNGKENCTICSGDCGTCPAPSTKITACTLPDKSWDEDSSLKGAYDLNACFKDPLGTKLGFGVSGKSSISVSISKGIVDLSAPADWNGAERVYFYAYSGNRSSSTNRVTLTVLPVADCGDGVCEGGESCDTCSSDCGECSSGGGGGGGGGGSITPTYEWVCGEWSECLNGEQVQLCEDAGRAIQKTNTKTCEQAPEPVVEEAPVVVEPPVVEQPVVIASGGGSNDALIEALPSEKKTGSNVVEIESGFDGSAADDEASLITESSNQVTGLVAEDAGAKPEYKFLAGMLIVMIIGALVFVGLKSKQDAAESRPAKKDYLRELNDYVVQSARSGFSREHVRTALAEVGWSNDVIEAIMARNEDLFSFGAQESVTG